MGIPLPRAQVRRTHLPELLHLSDRFAALRVGARLLRESDIGTDALIGGYSAAHLEMQQLFQDPELQVRPARIHFYSTQTMHCT